MSDAAPTHRLFSPREIRGIVLGLILSLFLSSLDQTIVATALSAIANDLGGWEVMPWVVSAYLISSTVTTPIYGRLSDIYGRRPVMLATISFFILGSVLAALAPNMLALIGARVVQGLGGGGMRALALAVVGDILPPRERGKVQGYLSGTFATANILGPVVGGFFVDGLSWHWIFWVNLPLGAAALVATWFQLRKLPLPGKTAKIDWLGAVLILCACTPLLLGITFVQRAGSWTAPDALLCFGLGVVFLLALIARERVAEQPMLPLQLFANRIFTAAICMTGLASMVMMSLVILVPLHYQTVAGLSAKEAGLRMIAMTMGTVSGSFAAGQAVSRTGRYRALLVGGTSVATAMCLFVSWFGLGHSLLVDSLVTLALGLAFGCCFSPTSIIVQNALPPRDSGIGISCMMFFRLMGGAFGVAFLSSLLLGALPAGASGAEAEAAFAEVFQAAAAIALLALVASLWLKEIPLRGRE